MLSGIRIASEAKQSRAVVLSLSRLLPRSTRRNDDKASSLELLDQELAEPATNKRDFAADLLQVQQTSNRRYNF
jgi:hypothetical protein